jgi:phosphohistidine phosphatase SixA
MRLYLVRHAEAAPGDPDELRRLTVHGRQQARELGERLADEQIDAVLTSPLLRARETGEEIARGTGSSAEPDERLAPGTDAETLRGVIAGRGDRVVVVGHQPDCGRIAAELEGGSEPAFPAAGMRVIELPA